MLYDVTQRLLHLDFAHLYDASFYYPAHLTLAMADAQIGLQPLALPLYFMFGDALLVLNILVIASFPITAGVSDLLGRYLTRSRVGGLVVGTSFAFAAYRFDHVIHLQLLQSWTIPLAYLGLEMTVQEDRRRGPVLWAFALVAAAYTSLNYLLLMAITQPVYLAARLAFASERRGLLLRLRRLIVPGLVAASLIAVAIIPYVELRLEGYHRTLAATFPFSARPIDYLTPATDSLAWHGLYDLHPPKVGIDERELFPGAILIASAVLGWVAALPRRNASAMRAMAPWLVAAAIGFLFSLGPYLWPDTAVAPASTDSLFALPYRYLAAPLLLESLRSPARFGVVVLLALAVMSAFAIVRGLSRLKDSRLRAVAVAILALGLAVEYSVSIPVQTVAWGPRLPATYAWLSKQPPGPVVELPALGVQVSYYLLASTVDGHPRLNGWSGFLPRELAPISQRVTPQSIPKWLAAARLLGARYLIVHADAVDPAVLAAVLAERDSGLLISATRFGTDEVFRFESPSAIRGSPLSPGT